MMFLHLYLAIGCVLGLFVAITIAIDPDGRELSFFHHVAQGVFAFVAVSLLWPMLLNHGIQH